MFSVDFSKFALKQFYKLNRNLQERIIKTLERIKIRPHHFVKRKAGTSYYILRVGDYRVILDIQNQKLIILVLELGPRNSIYSK
ncbi:cytotoxic translational repressor of toxin-antitoxin stability system [archaeon]|nr:cytotoxic translational repressor of toxin-antitoxin stability system [archaeon]